MEWVLTRRHEGAYAVGVTGEPSPTSQPLTPLLRAVETHAAIREGVPHEGNDGTPVTTPVTRMVAGASGSRRAPRTRKKAL